MRHYGTTPLGAKARITAGAVGALAVVSLAACGAVPDNSVATGQGASGEFRSAPTVTAQRGNITSSVAFRGVVQASPEFILVAPQQGTFHSGQPLENLGQAAETAFGQVDDTPVLLGQAGRVSRLLVVDGQLVDAGVPLATVKYSGFGVPVDVPTEQAYRIYESPVVGRVNVDSGPSGVECVMVPTGVASSSNGEEGPSADLRSAFPPSVSSSPQSATGAICLLPLGTKVFAGLSAQLGLPTATVENVLTLPLSAVSGSTGKGQVRVPASAQTQNSQAGAGGEIREVELGVTDGTKIEILSGLEEGEEVFALPPGIGQ